jgi:oligopeptide transport system substrate-binding protein
MVRTTQLLACLLALAACSARQDRPAGRVLRLALAGEPPQLDSSKATDTESGFLLGHLMEGLTRQGEGGKIIPGIAERWELGERRAVFHLRKTALWADGKPVTAHDFVFAWRLVADPANASEYAFIMGPIRNADAITAGKLPPSSLGVTAPDDWTLVVDFDRPCGYFLGLTAFPTYLPIREDFYAQKRGRFATDAGDLLSDGPFILTRWVHAAEITLEKNPRYWNADSVHLDRIEIPYFTTDSGARYNLFMDGKIDTLGIDKQDIDRAQADRLRMHIFLDGSVWYFEFNHRAGRPTANFHLRKAMQLAFDPGEFVSKVVGIPGTQPALSYIPSWVPGVKDRLRQEHPIVPVAIDLPRARQELELATKELGGRIPKIVLLTDDGPLSARQAEYFQNLFGARLGLEIRIDRQTFKQRLQKMTSGDFDLVAAGWGPDYADAMTFADLFTSWNENNRGKYRNPQYDALIRKAQATADPAARVAAMAEAQQALLADVGVLPTYERALIWVHQPWLHGVVRHVVGPDPDFVFASIRE